MNISNGTILKKEYGSPEIGDIFLVAGTEVGRESSEWRKTLPAVEQTHGESALCAASLGFYWATQEYDPTPGTSTQEHRKARRAFVVETVTPVMQPQVHSPWAWWRLWEWIWRLPRCLFNIHAFSGNLLLCLCLLSSPPVPPTSPCPVTSVEDTSLQLLSAESLHQESSFHQQWADAGWREHPFHSLAFIVSIYITSRWWPFGSGDPLECSACQGWEA